MRHRHHTGDAQALHALASPSYFRTVRNETHSFFGTIHILEKFKSSAHTTGILALMLLLPNYRYHVQGMEGRGKRCCGATEAVRI